MAEQLTLTLEVIAVSYTHLRVVCTREPGGTPIGEKIREIIIDKNNSEMANITEALLYAAARAQLVNEVIEPVLKDGGVVISCLLYTSRCV